MHRFLRSGTNFGAPQSPQIGVSTLTQGGKACRGAKLAEFRSIAYNKMSLQTLTSDLKRLSVDNIAAQHQF